VIAVRPKGKENWQFSFSALMLLLFALFVFLYGTSKTKVMELTKEVQSLKTVKEKQVSKTEGLFSGIENSFNKVNRGVRNRIQIARVDGGVLIRFLVSDFFKPLSVEAAEDFFPLIDEVGARVLNLGKRVDVIGYADASEGAKNAWELSALRAAWVVKRWEEHFGGDPTKIQASGKSIYHPVAEARDDALWASSQNRRVEVIVHEGEFVEGRQ